MILRRFLLALTSLMALTILLSWLANRPQDAGEAIGDGRLASLSFAPFREGMSPLEGRFPSPEQIDEDLHLLAGKTRSVRTYASLDGMEVVPELARRHGLSVTQGAWLGYPGAANAREIQALIDSANTHPDVVNRVIVGNEVLLRGEMEPQQLIEYIRQVKRAVAQPVSYADVWSMYMKYPQLIREVDFITIHILPYWEDEPVAVSDAPAHLTHAYNQVRREADSIAPGKPILIGETGWPAAGRQRGHAVPGVVNEARFIRAFVHAARDAGFDYNIVEAFNQPWKRALEGVVGANWGLFDANRQPVFPLAGSVTENSGWQLQTLCAVVLWLLVALVCYRRVTQLPLPQQLLWLGLSQLLLLLLIKLAFTMQQSAVNHLQSFYGLAVVTASAVMVWLIIQRAFDLLATVPQKPQVGSLLRAGYFLFIALALYDTAMLAWNGRYLLFPSLQLAVPVAGIITLSLCIWLQERRFSWSISMDQLTGMAPSRWSRLLLVALPCMALALVAGEMRAFLVGRDFILAHPDRLEQLRLAVLYTLTNGQLLIWLACLTVLALPLRRAKLA